MSRGPSLTTSRAAEIFEKMIEYRREFCRDGDFFRMPKIWDSLCEVGEDWSIKTYKSNQTEDFKRKAGVVAFGHMVTLVVDEELLANAKHGCMLSNFILAHELGHLALDHHAEGAVIKHFQLFAGPSGMSNLPPTVEELEANYAAVFFQCGVALLDHRLEAIDSARRAYSDATSIKKAQRIVRLDVFQRELNRPRARKRRVVL